MLASGAQFGPIVIRGNAPATGTSVTNTASVAGADVDSNTANNTASATTSLTAQAPALTVQKTANPTSVTTAGAPIVYSYRVSNIGNVPLTGISVAETAFTGTGPRPSASCPATSLDPGASMTCTANYTATQADVDRGSIVNTAVANGTSPAGVAVVSPPTTATVTAAASPSLTVAKTASPSDAASFTVGRVITYSYRITNTGNVTLTNVRPTDTAFNGSGPRPTPTCPSGAASLAPGASVTCTATYTVTQADVDRGSLTNTATATGTPPSGSSPPTSPPSTVTVPGDSAPALTVRKSASPTTMNAAGNTITYRFLVTNTGNVTLNSVSIAEPTFTGTGGAPAVTCPSGPLLPGAQTTCTATYSVTQADMDRGTIDNTATASAVAPDATRVTSAPSSARVTADRAPALAVVKSATPTTVTAAGDAVNYSFRVTNTGNVSLDTITVADTQFSGTGTPPAPSCPPGVLAPGASTTCTASYTATQADIDAGSISNTATASGRDPTTGNGTTSPPSSATVIADATPGLSLVKTADPTRVTAAGQTVTFGFLVTNTSAVTLNDPQIAETDFTGSGPAPAPTCPSGPLAPGAQVRCTATYTTTQADVDRGSIVNIATASATPPSGSPVVSDPSTVTVTAAATPGITVVKTATPQSVSAAGQTVDYAFQVTNTGNVTMNSVGITDTEFTGTGPAPEVSCPSSTLAPGISMTCTASYTATQADIDAGGFDNTATATGTPPGSTPQTSPPSSTTVTAERAASLALVKSADPSVVNAAGQTVDYSFLVTNTGNATVNDLAVTETDFSGSGPAPEVSCPTDPLAPGASTTCTASYSATQADIDAGSITNTATAGGTDPAGDPVTSPPSSATVVAAVEGDISLFKSANPETVSAAGDQVTFEFLVTNVENVTLNAIRVDEVEFTGTGTLSPITCPPGPLAPGEQRTCTATYAATQADINAGSVTNTATASGTEPDGTDVTSEPASVVVTAEAAPAMTVVKSAQPQTVTAAGQTIDYSYQVTNTGNVTVDGVSVTETDFTGTGPAPTPSCPDGPLAPGESTTCTASYTATQADIDAGGITNTATTTGTPPGGPPVTSPPSTSTVTTDPSPALTVAKTGEPATVSAAGQTITYSYEVRNTGNQTVTDVAVDESGFTGTGPAPAATCPTTTLAPGESTTCTATYTVTQGDIDAGGVTNTGVATAQPPGGAPPVSSPPSTVTTGVEPNPSLAVVKSATPTHVARAGDVITYHFEATNTGNVTLTGVRLDEAAFTGTGDLGPATCTGGPTLAPGEKRICDLEYAVTQADIDAGSISNGATASGQPPSGARVTSPPAFATVTSDPAPAIMVDKTADPTTLTGAGQTVTYSFLVTNSGNVTLHDVGIRETGFSGSGQLPPANCPTTSLEPGQQTTCTTSYAAAQTDVDQGFIANSAVAVGTGPGGAEAMSEQSAARVEIPPQPALSLVKTSDPTTASAAGDQVTFEYAVTNTGNVTLNGVGVGETEFSGTGQPPVPTCPPEAAVLAPGATVTCTASYTLTQADVDAGGTTNTAVAGATPPGGPPAVISPPSTSTVTVDPGPGLSVVKSANPSSVDSAGDVVTYEFVVTNTGNVTMEDVSVAETDFTGTGPAPVATCPPGPLAPGAQTTCTAPYTVTQADVDAGSISNTATATGEPPGSDTPIPPSPPSSTTVTIDPAPGLSVVKSVDPAGPESFAVGQELTYTFVATNTGNVTLHDVAIDDEDFSGSGGLGEPTCTGDPASVAPGEQIVCTATYVVTQADVDAGGVRNSATATGIPPAPGSPPVTSPPSQVEVPQDPQPGLSLVKTADTEHLTGPGQVITYSFLITNTGNVTLDRVAVDEGEFTGSGPLSPVTCPDEAGSLSPGEQATCTATYTVTQSDVDRGELTNTATAGGTPPGGGGTTSPPSSATITGDAKPVLEVLKTAHWVDDNGSGVVDLGDRIAWTITATNTGGATATDVVVSDPTAGAVTCPATTLAPGESMDCTAPDHVVDEADVAAGEVANTAIATGRGPGGDPVTSPPASSTVEVGRPGTPPGPQPEEPGGPGDLATTGRDVGLLLALAGALLAFGGLLFSGARRRRRS
ncbi:DUF7507 domain-containing protein [Saccharopolyspora flava]|uniref:Conserved repeat domain-containing protein n=1 Tax=Saccharopolyspora flava TaxID=95161 RepID=A0A1I6TJT3_9PSEU|nr:DUF11 domain-containing protein [Saccharopolyspora flava]SFS89479.1 conserved repeat domain-containing protein [Saccharopolyspora flava]